ncbi:MAG: DUF2459 domain-containing protein [Sphingomonadales bacterium CG12_big_fil_rev_8_21_14_0_65_65_10]|uniref:DUF2459 domain-containing protein n=1 Tax=Blastomonas marina TaxID=1867408 RepID=UPI000CBD8EDA|nr:DUF2459 domain-containing protein [Blastomonas marina]PIW54796.1 MAG: DUF2459 domain-containing protein [Sphingomonadales bacterium CG12_big_fil_rev_8_21_14_0_65_65_10]WPZ04570.1 DUF2459 domain-containing protein [Blastomonas marina]
MRGIAKFIGKALAWIALFLGLVMLWNWAGSSIPRNAGAEPAESGVEILLATNGIHTELVLPVTSPQKDWRETFPSIDNDYPGRAITHIGVGWGDREVFLENPSWGDLEARTVWRIATTGGPGVVRVDHLTNPGPGPNKRPIRLSERQYAALVAAIEAELAPAPAGRERPVLTGFRAQDRFYDARADYTLGNTCNQWTSDRLADAGVETGYWTPFAGGVMKWVEEPPN